MYICTIRNCTVTLHIHAITKPEFQTNIFFVGGKSSELLELAYFGVAKLSHSQLWDFQDFSHFTARLKSGETLKNSESEVELLIIYSQNMHDTNK